MALAPDGALWIVEVKSSIDDFRADTKWPDYRLHCDRLFFAIPDHVPAEIMPDDAGLILADAYGAAILREPGEHRLAAATRKAMLLRFAIPAPSGFIRWRIRKPLQAVSDGSPFRTEFLEQA